MTKEEKIAELVNIRDNFNYTLAPREVFDDAIKALEQELILEKIRVEIEEERKVEHIPEDVEMWDYIRALDRTLSIVDKYRIESEG